MHLIGSRIGSPFRRRTCRRLLLLSLVSRGIAGVASPIDTVAAPDKGLSLQQDSTVATPTAVTAYPARALMLSLAVPGTGQWYAGSTRRAAVFGAMELAAWSAWRQLLARGEDAKKSFQRFADTHWDVEDWIDRVPLLNSEFPDVAIEGTHHLRLLLPDQSIVSSDTLSSGWIEGASVIRDRDFYENIGKYDQFVAGWDDLFDIEGQPAWWIQEKDVGDTTETIVMTGRRKKFLGQRADHNRLLQFASYAISAIMFNHLVSGIDAAVQVRRRFGIPARVHPSIGLLISPRDRIAVRGVSLSVVW